MLYSNPATNHAQCTLKESVHYTAPGAHNGREMTLALLPAPPNSGTHFLRRDVAITRAVIHASWQSIVDTHPDMQLGNEYGIGVRRIETLLAALHGCGVDNVLIEVNNYELPNFDGSSIPIIEMINQTGVITQGAARQVIWMDKAVGVRVGEHYACIMPGGLPSITIDDASCGAAHVPQHLSSILLEHVFEREIAPARQPRYNTPSGERGDDHESSSEMHTPRFADESMRYRTLESLGLLALTEMPIYGQIYLYKPCAFLINALLQALFAARESWRQLSYAEVEQVTGKLSVSSAQQVSDRRQLPADPLTTSCSAVLLLH